MPRFWRRRSAWPLTGAGSGGPFQEGEMGCRVCDIALYVNQSFDRIDVLKRSQSCDTKGAPWVRQRAPWQLLHQGTQDVYRVAVPIACEGTLQDANCLALKVCVLHPMGMNHEEYYARTLFGQLS
jgi:hypothetical protein